MTEIFTPFLTAFILAYALRPVCLWLERHRLPRAAAAGIAMIVGLVVVFLILTLFITLLKTEIPLIKDQLPSWIQNTQAWLGPKLSELNMNVDWSTLKSSATQKITTHLNDNSDALMSSTLARCKAACSRRSASLPDFSL